MAASSATDLIKVEYVCQYCSAPLILDRSFDDIQALSTELASNFPSATSSTTDGDDEDDDTVTLIGGSITGGGGTVTGRDDLGQQQQQKSSSSTADLYVTSTVGRRSSFTPPGCQLTDSGNGFTLVGEPGSTDLMHHPTSGGAGGNDGQDETGTSSLSHTLAVSSRLFDIASDQSEIGHPLCEECTDALLDQLDQMLKVTEDEYRDYHEFFERFEASNEQGGDSVDVETLAAELEGLAAEERRLVDDLKTVEAERVEAERELKVETMEMERLRADEEHFLREYFGYKRRLLLHGDEQRSVENQLRYAQMQLDRLKKTNVFNTSFHIWHSGHFGTINNFRLGRLPSVPVEWSEINAAWGQTVLLLHSLANKIELKFQRYRLVPYGNHSYVECIADRSRELPLYGSGGIRFFWDTKFDQAMVAFLDCLQQFKEEVEQGDTGVGGFCLPYRMDRAGHIEDTGMGNSYSVKTQFNSEEQWTKALKFMLTNLKWGLAWVSSQFATK